VAATGIDIPARDEATPAAPPPRRRRVTSRLSTGHVVMLLAGLLAALANLALIRSSNETVPVLVAREDIAVGTVVGPDMLRTVDARLDGGVLATLVGLDRVRSGYLDGKVATAAVPAGSPLRLGDLRPTATSTPDERRIAIPIDESLAVGGAIAVDDRIDVIQVIEGVPRYIVAGARVLATADPGGSAIGSASDFFVTIGADPETALCLAAAIDGGGLTLVLSTGQEPVPTSPCVAPPAPTDDTEAPRAAGRTSPEGA
jgi:Flp pilus assembly protein CpaB